MLHPDGAAKLMQHVKDQDGTNEISSVIIYFTFFFITVSPNRSQLLNDLPCHALFSCFPHGI